MDTHKMTSTRIKTLIIRDVQDFAGRQSQHDDMTVLVVKVH
jgi:serine phosphatase RsbU (regulator of sigma subunit)